MICLIFQEPEETVNIHSPDGDEVPGFPAWPHFPSAARAGHIQVSALGQLLGQNGNIASMVSSGPLSEAARLPHLPTGRQSVSSSEEYPPLCHHHSLPLG